MPVYAQNPPSQALAEENVLEEVIVTGSRIRRSNLDSPSPVLVIDASSLVDAGITTMGEFARYLPQNSEMVSDANSAGSSNLGSSAFNLRGIGFDGTLTLVNGRRIAPFGNSGGVEPYVDINAIPIAAIQRIEVLKDGASAIYGSEAVAGVVNIILKDRVDGLTAEAGYLTNNKGDGDEWDANIVGGWNSDSTRLVGTLSWYQRDLIWRRDRKWAEDLDRTAFGGRNGRSSFSSPATIDLLDSGQRRADPACPEYTMTNNREVQQRGSRVVESCRFNWAQFTTLQQPAERWSGTALLQHDFSNGSTAYGELIYNHTEAQAVLAPTPLPFFFVPASHPENPFGENLLIRYRAIDTGNRGQDIESTTWRALAGIQGDWNGWDWDVAVTSSESENINTLRRAILSEEFQDALLGLGGPNGDQYYNPFGLNPQNSQEVIDGFLISGPQFGATTSESTFDAQISGKFGSLPGGSIGAAVGVQWRELKLDEFVDDILRGDSIATSGGFVPVSADRRISSVFVEFVLPVFDKLEAQLALRYDDYSDFGSTTNPKIGLGWRPVDDVLIRATWGTSFRAPTFVELYESSLDYFTFVSEDSWRCPATGNFADCFGQELPATSSGNPALEPDEGETWLLGVAWEPTAIPGLEFALDYWEINHTNRVVSSGDPFGFGWFYTFFENLPPDENPYVQRAAQTPEDIALGIPGQINSILVTYINSSTLNTRGIDFDARYAWSTASTGDFELGLSYSYLDEYKLGVDVQGEEFLEDYAGWYGFWSGLPQHRGTFNASWILGSHAASAQVMYSGSFDSFEDEYLDGIPTGNRFEIGTYAQLNLQYSYTFHQLRGATVRLGCQNCLDKDPPVYNHVFPTEPFHEGRGVLMYIRWVQPF